MKWFRALLSLLLTGTLVYLLHTQFGSIPPLGKFLNPFGGFWENAETKHLPAETNLEIPGLRGKVQVLFDNQLVPHIFAQNDYDLYFAQGYVTATHRLWQMEIQTHAAAGRASEIVGERALASDRHNRRMGMVYAAEQSLKTMRQDSTTRQMLEAYTAGVNTYIDELVPAAYPVEYKLLNYAPEPWTPLKCALLLKQMASTLSGGSDDLYMTNVLQQYGKEVVKDLFPDYPFREDPIIPTGTKWDFTPVPVPNVPEGYATAASDSAIVPRANPDVGSNNWAVSAEKSATGYPILANDPHLTLSLPSIWYQIQLVSPTVNVCGVSLPGSPAVIIGFNRNVSWGVTNVGSDVLDFYQIKFKDNSRSQYWHDNQWKPVREVVEVIKIKGQPEVIDTVLYTHHGPVAYESGEAAFNSQTPVNHAVKWAAHQSLNEPLTFHLLNRANKYEDYVQALSHYGSPAQNFAYADVYRDIALWPNGRFPLKWENQGKFVLDGSNPAHDWQGWIPHEHNPHVKNPPRGFVSSANQFPADTTYPYYLGWLFENSSRAIRINQRLSAMQRATPDSLRMLQNDNFNIHAQTILPSLLSYLYQDKLTGEQKAAFREISGWNLRNDATSVGATIFTRWWNNLEDALWQDDFGSATMRYPSRDRSVHLLLSEPQSRWIDNVRTKPKETLGDLVNQSFRSAVDTLVARHGSVGESWQWAQVKSTDILHLARLAPFSAMDVETGGGSGIINATSERQGPSWRMVVALGPTVRAYGVYPGGQSGNPGSYYYDNLLETWRTGELHELVFLQRADEPNERIVSRWMMQK